MHGRKASKDERIYPTYDRYPVSRDDEGENYAPDGPSEGPPGNTRRVPDAEPFSFITDPTTHGDRLSRDRFPSDDDSSFRPLRLLHSLFSARLSFLQRALEELEADRTERQHLTREALEELDSDVRECEHALSSPGLLHPERKRDLERRLLELKRERRREMLLSWRDLAWLRGEIRKLQREIEALRSTPTRKEDAAQA